MAIPSKLTPNDIFEALKYIDENGIPDKNKSREYALVSESGIKYPPKYVVAVAHHLSTGDDIDTSTYNAVEAKNFLRGLGFMIEQNQEKFELVITADNVTSTDERFTMNNLSLGDNYKPLNAYFKKSNGEKINRKRDKGERKSSNQTMPRIACQVFERQLAELSVEEKENFPVCRYSLNSEIIKGIFPSVAVFKQHRNTIEYVVYNYGDGRQFVFYCWNIFSTIIFVQECIKRFGDAGDEFVLTYREKDKKEREQPEVQNEISDETQDFNGYLNPYSDALIESKNIIFRGAPGTGKSYLAKEIAADIISNGYFDDYTLLTDEQKKQVEFVQLHPSYDYSDFVEGLRPRVNDDGSMSFQLEDGIFTKFVKRAQKNYDDANRSREDIEKQNSAIDVLNEYFSNIEFGIDELSLARGTKFYITSVDEEHIHVSIPDNPTIKSLNINKNELLSMIESGQDFNRPKDVTEFFEKQNATQAYSYDLAIFKDLKSKNINAKKTEVAQESVKPFIFIIDEINRAEISKVLGELFFSIDPGYRGSAGEVSTQYASLHENPDKKFSIPENVYIIGTMNDIDRSVDSFDFAMRRRFRFIEIKAEDRLEMLESLGDELKEKAITRMEALNNEISNVDELNENYYIGASYFLKLSTLTFDQLWTDHLLPLIQDYVRGMYDEEGILKKFARAYGYPSIAGDVDENIKG
ncbi:McrB family protein [Lactococcus lactis]|uniref:ATPase family protein n=1 Tax=Lactococcus lactis subsp. lactis A12 TaxID=1137134 RepID=S6ESI2_LACLL|nr:AAA family ATPase [Lactococcus lactis]CDG04270.1 ATPase family protein [Lactococcus lactis subsp. lactis A12]SBW30180.1 ATPase family protein [Lactococcus lactis subsp. lactis]